MRAPLRKIRTLFASAIVVAIGVATAHAASSQNFLHQLRARIQVDDESTTFTGYVNSEGTYENRGGDNYHFNNDDLSGVGFAECNTSGGIPADCGGYPNIGPSKIGDTRAYYSTARVSAGSETQEKLATIFVNPFVFFVGAEDVYTQGELEGLHVNFGDFGVIGTGSESALDKILATNKLKNYKIDKNSTAYWDEADPTFNRNERLRGNIERLLKERAVQYPTGSTVRGLVDLNTPVNNPTAAPEGGVVVFRPGGTLALDNVTLHGPGTIIIEGNLLIQGDLKTPAGSPPVGIIVRKPQPNSQILDSVGVQVEDSLGDPTRQTIQGAAFFIPNGAFDAGTGDSPLYIEGAVVANEFKIADRQPGVRGEFDITFKYDARITDKVPPGFGLLVLPKVIQQSP